MQRPSILLLAIVLTMASLGASLRLATQATQGVDSSAGQDMASTRPVSGSMPGAPHASLDLVAEYAFDQTDQEAALWTLGRDGRAGKRLSFLLTGSRIKTYAEPSLVKTAVNHRRPMIWLNRNEDKEPNTYTLVAISDPELLLRLQMDRVHSLSTIMPNLPSEELRKTAKDVGLCPRDLGEDSRVPVEELAIGRALSATLQGELVAPDGTFVPITISHVDFQHDAELAQLCYNTPGFVLLAPSFPGWQDYQLHMVLKNNVAGPPGEGWVPLCSSWQAGNWWNRFLATLYGC
ncbi:MAG TPA: hypothetical protein PKM78_02095 [Anaerolineae bacterium]|nr:hypothetical protein [Anaerolineae bacterium]HNU02790.1 hypothetical protein [Anaerolineae bacterium]